MPVFRVRFFRQSTLPGWKSPFAHFGPHLNAFLQTKLTSRGAEIPAFLPRAWSPLRRVASPVFSGEPIVFYAGKSAKKIPQMGDCPHIDSFCIYKSGQEPSLP